MKQQRGILIRTDGPEILENSRDQLFTALSPIKADLVFEGRDGTGLKTEVPWIRIACRDRSPTAQRGWYCAYLFHAAGKRLYLCLMHGATQFINGEFVPRSDDELNKHVTWARKIIAELRSERMVEKIRLGSKGKLGSAYEKSSAVAFWCPQDQLAIQNYESGLFQMVELLRLIYDEQDLGRAPGTESYEVDAAELSAETISRPALTFNLIDLERSKGPSGALPKHHSHDRSLD